MAGAQALGHDFLGVEKEASDRRRSFRGIQSAISKMNPEVIKSVIHAAAIQKENRENIDAPMTIFYNGMVTFFHVPKDQAESIFKMAVAESSKNVEAEKAAASSTTTPLRHQGDLVQQGLPIARRKSLERFFEKRKERLMSVSPYETPKGHETDAAKWAW